MRIYFGLRKLTMLDLFTEVPQKCLLFNYCVLQRVQLIVFYTGNKDVMSNIL